MRLLPRTILALAAAVAVSVPADAIPVCTDQVVGINERCPVWTASYNHTGRGGRGEDIGRDVAVSPDGATVYVTGQSRDDATGDDQAVVAFDAATGARRWVGRYSTAGSTFDTGSALAVSPDGTRVYAAGRSTGPDGSFDWITVAYAAANGQRLWDARYAFEGSDRTWGVATSPDGSEVYVVGEVAGGDIGAVAYDAATGEELWTGAYDGGGYDWALDIGVSPDGGTLYAAGTTGTATTGIDLVAVAFRAVGEEGAAPGSIRWVSGIDGGQRGTETFAGFDVGEDGESLAVAGFTTVGGIEKSLTALVDAATGQERWRALHDALAGDNDLRDTVALQGNRVARVAWGMGEGVASGEYLTLVYRAQDGSLLWSRMQGSDPLVKDVAKTVSFSPDGARLFVSGYSVVPYGQTGNLRIEPGLMMTVAYDAATGARRWVARHNESGVGQDVAIAAEPSPDGRTVFVGGTFITSGVHVWPTDLAMAYAYDFGVVAYNA